MPGSGGAHVEVTVCHPTETTSELVKRRYYTWTTPKARGVVPLHHLTDFLGIAVGGHQDHRSRAGCALRRSLPRGDSPVVTLSTWGSSNLVNAANS